MKVTGIKRELYLDVIQQYEIIYNKYNGLKNELKLIWNKSTKCQKFVQILTIVCLAIYSICLICMLFLKSNFDFEKFVLAFIIPVVIMSPYFYVIYANRENLKNMSKKSKEYRIEKMSEILKAKKIYDVDNIDLLYDFFVENKFYMTLSRRIIDYIHESKISSAFIGFCFITFFNVYGKVLSETISALVAFIFLLILIMPILYIKIQLFVHSEPWGDIYEKKDIGNMFKKDLKQIFEDCQK